MAYIIWKLLLMCLFHIYHVRGQVQLFNSWANYYEKRHNPPLFSTTMNPVVDAATGTRRPHQRNTPDFRLPQHPLEPWDIIEVFESHRPYRVSPHYRQTYHFKNEDRAWLYGCYCTTVYIRYWPLAGCAVITTRHILTTATSTQLILRKYRNAKTLENILGFWYDVDRNWYNSSMYGTPCRIHYHPFYLYPKDVNRSHPFPVMFDLAVWATTIRISNDGIVCERAGPHRWEYTPNTPQEYSEYVIFGYQFMRAYNRRPYPFFKYAVRVPKRESVIPCPKTEWGWYHCWKTGSWAPLGMDNGAPIHRRSKGYWRYDGLMGMNVITMRLRSLQQTSYFIDLSNYITMEFLYDAYNGKFKPEYLDERFEDSFNRAPLVKPGHFVPVSYPRGKDYYYSIHCCLPEFHRPGYSNGG
ncbi:uncharacterized protein LOC128680425 [Plodia interpunctella]|uniref:uncharacterized protein LOC128680425 n=1 Tax=Plodia interpunctella TaxID=58824 RepID=UPI002368EEA2|nr:uncharacterized protein LOC128680425 [Plodia interpunctella]